MASWLIEFCLFQAEDGMRDLTVTGVQTCALPIYQQQGHSHFVRRKLTENGSALAVDGDAIRMRIFCRHFFQVDFSGARVQSAHHVGHLEREPQHALAVEDSGVRVLAFRVRNLIFRNDSSAGIELSRSEEHTSELQSQSN